MRAKFSEAERRWDFSEQGDDVDVLDSALGVGVVLAPESGKSGQDQIRVPGKKLVHVNLATEGSNPDLIHIKIFWDDTQFESGKAAVKQETA